MSSRLQVLLVEDNPGDARLIRAMLTEDHNSSSFEITWADRLSKALEALNTNPPEAVLLDLSLPDSQGLSTVATVVKNAPDAPIVILTGNEDEALATRALQDGAQDYLPKSQLTGALLERTIRYSIDRKLAEQSLRDSEEHYRLLFENNPLPLLVYDLKTLQLLAVNDAAIELYGYSSEEFLQMHIHDLQPVDELPPLQDILWHTLKPDNGSGPWKQHKKDGSLINVEISSHDLIFDGKKACLVLINDITERLRAEMAEDEQRALAEALRDTASALNSTLDLDELLGRILDNVVRVVPHDAANIGLLEGGLVRIVRNQGYSGYELLKPTEIEMVRADDVPSYRQMLSTGQTALVPDVRTEPSWAKKQDTKWICSYVGAPISIRGKIIGFINLNSASAGFFTPLHARHLQAFADQAGSALENAHLLEETRQRVKELEAVNKISTALRVSQTLDEMIPQFLDETISALQGVGGSFWFYEPANEEIRMVYQHGWDGIEFRSVRYTDETILGKVIESGNVYISKDFKSDSPLPSHIREQIPANWSAVCIPIRAATEIIGAMFINIESPREFSQANMHLLDTLAEIAGNAIHRTRLNEQTEQRLGRIAALHDIDIAISSSFDLDLTLNVLLSQVTTQLNVEAADVLLFDPILNVLQFSAGRGFRSKVNSHVQIRPGDGLAGKIVVERRTLAIPNLNTSDQSIKRIEMLRNEEFVAYHGVPLISKGQFRGVLEVFHRKQFKPDLDWLDFLETLAGQAAIAIDGAILLKNLQQSNLELSMAYEATIEGWSHALDLRDKETEGHTLRVTEMTLRLAQALNLSSTELLHIRRGALLHDIGKMGIPDHILLKPGKLTDEEVAIMRMHPTYAFQMLYPIQYLRPALDIPYCHHEKWDGSGYPRKLAGAQIPFAARIFAVVDVWDALRFDRPYRKGWSEEKVLEHIREETGTHFDPTVVEVFMNQVAL
jgi:PAS domain S-box-containing protein/putative nucleotidyltransferase with HDIG domain